jgi:hypothetical protein
MVRNISAKQKHTPSILRSPVDVGRTNILTRYDPDSAGMLGAVGTDSISTPSVMSVI